MRTDYYMMVTDWGAEIENKVPSVKFEMVTRYDEIHAQRALVIAKQYEKELNNGKPWDPRVRIIAGDKDIRFSVKAIPYNQAREYTSFATWPCNKESL